MAHQPPRTPGETTGPVTLQPSPGDPDSALSKNDSASGTDLRWISPAGQGSALNRRTPTEGINNVRTYTPKPGDADAQWHIIDATDVVLGRLATQSAALLRGKHKPTFVPHQDMGDFVIIINADKVAVTGDKAEKKRYWRHSGFPGGIKSLNFNDLMQRHPTRAVELAVKGMLPHNKLGRAQLKKLRVYAGAEHPHAAQQPQPFEISQVAQ